MHRSLIAWLSISIAGGAAVVGAVAAIGRACWLVGHGNPDVLFSKPIQLFILIGGSFFIAAAAWGAPAILVWVLAVRRQWPRLGHSPVASVLGPTLGAAALAA